MDRGEVTGWEVVEWQTHAGNWFMHKDQSGKTVGPPPTSAQLRNSQKVVVRVNARDPRTGRDFAIHYTAQAGPRGFSKGTIADDVDDAVGPNGTDPLKGLSMPDLA